MFRHIGLMWLLFLIHLHLTRFVKRFVVENGHQKHMCYHETKMFAKVYAHQ
jgi:hypothetical protein